MADTRVTISVQEFDTSTITLPTEITLEEGDIKDLSEYFPQGQFTLTTQSTFVSVNGYTITAVSTGEATIVVSSQIFGEVATCKIIVTAKQTPPTTSNSSSTINSNITSNSSNTTTSNPSNTNASSIIGNSNSQNTNEGVEDTPSSSGGCGSSISGTSVLIVFVAITFAVVLCIKKTKKQ